MISDKLEDLFFDCVKARLKKQLIFSEDNPKLNNFMFSMFYLAFLDGFSLCLEINIERLKAGDTNQNMISNMGLLNDRIKKEIKKTMVEK
jgi:hypothetical protein